jgi:hypothetical protein
MNKKSESNFERFKRQLEELQEVVSIIETQLSKSSEARRIIDKLFLDKKLTGVITLEFLQNQIIKLEQELITEKFKWSENLMTQQEMTSLFLNIVKTDKLFEKKLNKFFKEKIVPEIKELLDSGSSWGGAVIEEDSDSFSSGFDSDIETTKEDMEDFFNQLQTIDKKLPKSIGPKR